jgi:hypothetical protein
MTLKTDIDIDLKDRNAALSVLPHIPATMSHQGKVTRHNTGVYFHNIPVDPLTDQASITYLKAEDMGYFKMDFINNTVYTDIRDSEHLETLLAMEPTWELLDDPDIVSMLVHIHSHFDIVNIIKPKSVEDLSVVLALIRPAKRHLLHKSRAEIDAEIWERPSDGSYHYKKAHAVAYAVSIVVQLNAIVEKSWSKK